MDGNTYSSFYESPDIYVNPDIEGYLTEKFKVMRNTKTWCSLQGPTLYLQKNQGGVIQTLDMAKEVHTVRTLADASQFEIVCKKGKQTFICPSPNECTNWVTALQKAMSLKSNGFGHSSFFQPPPPDPEDTNLYAEPTDDATPESVYDDVVLDKNQGGGPVLQDTGQTSGRTVHVQSWRPPLPPMHNRQQQETYEEPVAPSQTVVSTVAGEYSEAQSTGDQTATESESIETAEYTEAQSVQSPETIPNATREYSYAQQSQSDPNPAEEYTDGMTLLHEDETSKNLEEDKSEGNSAEQAVTLRPRASLTSSYLPTMRLPEGETEEDENSNDNEDDQDNENEDQEYADAFSELNQALTCADASDLNLEFPVTAEDFHPLEQLHDFLANNSQILEGTLQQRVLLDPGEDPVANLKVFLQQLQV